MDSTNTLKNVKMDTGICTHECIHTLHYPKHAQTYIHIRNIKTSVLKLLKKAQLRSAILTTRTETYIHTYTYIHTHTYAYTHQI